jgi:hypothetical protein
MSSSAGAGAAFACSVCGARAATPNADDELVCDVCGTLSQVREICVWVCVGGGVWVAVSGVVCVR